MRGMAKLRLKSSCLPLDGCIKFWDNTGMGEIEKKAPSPPRTYSYIARVLALLIIGIAVIRIAPYLSRFFSVEKPTPVKKSVLLVTPSAAMYATYKNTNAQYSVKIPNDWAIKEGEDRVSFTPRNSPKTGGYPIGVTINTKASSDTPLTSQQAFDDWKKKNAQDTVNERIQKVADIAIDNQDAVILRDTQVPEKQFSLIAWFRKNEINYYFNYQGSGETVTQEDMDLFNSIIKSFKSY